jgi:acetolactate synthase-1/2/3 large subunit
MPSITDERVSADETYGEAHALRDSYIRELFPAPTPNRRENPAKTSNLAPDAAALRLVEALVERGVDTFFGIPGGPVCPVFEAIRMTPGARLIESRHESNAAFSAAAYFRACGKVPAVVVTAGPGITNAVTGIASASLERCPMLVIAGDVAWATHGGRMAQDSGPEGISAEIMLAPVTRLQIRAAHARSVVSQALAGLSAATNPLNPGPVLFVLPLDRAMDRAARIHIVAPEAEFVHTPPAASVEHAARLLSEAERPLVVIGAGCRGHEDAVRAFLDASGLPFLTTPRAKGLVSERHPRSLRHGGMAASIWARRYTAEPVDVCLALGTDLDDTSMGPTRYVGPEGKLIHVDLDSRVFGRNLPTALGVTSEVGSFCQALGRSMAARGLTNLRAQKALRQAKSVSPFDEASPELCQATPVRPHRLVSDLERAAGEGARFITDIGEHMLFALHYLTAHEPDSFQVQLNLGSMGSGIAGAVGIALADPSRRVVCIAGDGCMQMAGMEALVAVREKLPILFVVFNDGRYNMVHHGMKQIFGAAENYDTPPVDFAGWARSFNMRARRVERPGEITAQLIDDLMAHGGPALIDARIDSSVRIRGGGRVEALQHMSMLSRGTAQEST